MERIKVIRKGKTSQEQHTNSDHDIYTSHFHLLYEIVPQIHESSPKL